MKIEHFFDWPQKAAELRDARKAGDAHLMYVIINERGEVLSAHPDPTALCPREGEAVTTVTNLPERWWEGRWVVNDGVAIKGLKNADE